MIEGGCKCGAVRYTLDVEAMPPIYCCHCLTCQSWSGSAFSEQAVVAESAISVTGPVVDFRLTNPSGAESHQRVCGTCHSRIFNTNSERPGLAVVRAGTLDDSHTLVPKVHIWVKRKQPWVQIAEGEPVYDETPSPAEFFAALTR